MEILNAQITSTKLGREDHGIMTFMIFVKTESYSVGVGGFALDQYSRETKDRIFSATGLEAISKILEIVGVDNWEDLPGKYIRIKDNGLGTPIEEIGNLIEDKWFNIGKFFRSAYEVEIKEQ